MESSYKIIGGDGKEYGPVPLEQLQSWVDAGRVGPATQVWRSDVEAWREGSNYGELRFPAVDVTTADEGVPTRRSTAVDVQRLAAAAKSGAGWFYWIAGLSVVNSLASFSGTGWQFIVGLGITQVFDAVASHSAGEGKAVALALDILAAGLFVFFGVFANRRQSWAFVVGMIIYALDGLLLFLAGSLLGAGFHGFVLFSIFAGFTAHRKLLAAERG
jgi:hypothetical protein